MASAMDSRLPAAGTNGISDWPVYSISECISAVWVTPRQRPASESRHSLILTAQTAPLSVPGQPTSSPICAGGDPNRSPEPFHIGTKASQIAGAGALSDRSGRCAGRHVHRPERASPKGSPASGPSETCSSVLTRAAICGGDAWSAPPTYAGLRSRPGRAVRSPLGASRHEIVGRRNLANLGGTIR